MHFILTQTKESKKYFYNNVAIAHLLLTILSVWLGHFKQRESNCGYFQAAAAAASATTNNEIINQNLPKLYTRERSSLDEKLLFNDTLADDTRQVPTIMLNSTSAQSLNGFRNTSSPIESSVQIATVAAIQFATNATSTFSDLLMPIIHHFQILTVFILISIWLNNNRTKANYHRTRLCETESINCFNETEFVANSLLNTSTRLKSIKGFFLGLLTISTTIVVLTTGNDYFLIATHSIIQVNVVVF